MKIPFVQLSFLILLLFCGITEVEASVDSDLQGFFSSLGYASNVTSASSYQTQAAGYYDGGSLFLRNQVKNLQLVHLDMPSYRAGCGGINLFFGGFSYIKSDELIKFFQNVLSSSGGYAFNLAMETSVPQLAHVMQYMQSIADRVNSANMNSCEMAENLVGGVWPKNRRSQEKICEDIGTHNGKFADWAEARQECRKEKGFNETMDVAANDPAYQNQVLRNKNLIWSAIQKNSFLSNNTELAELLMTLSGTEIYDANGSVTILTGSSDNRNLIKALMYGGSAPTYHCDEATVCLKPSLSTITIQSSKSLVTQVQTMVTNMSQKLKEDVKFTDEENGFLNAQSIPIFKFMMILQSLHQGVSTQDLLSYSELMAKELLKQYLMENLQLVKRSLTQVDYPNKKELLQNLQEAMVSVDRLTLSTHHDLQETMALVKNMRLLERELSGELSEQLKDNLAFGEGT